MIKMFSNHHNKIQFFGYEVANVIWILYQTSGTGQSDYGFNGETYTALAFLVGSGLIWRFDPVKRPHLLFYGGMMLALGGLLLASAGFLLTGLAVVLASLETARGGMGVLAANLDQRQPAATARHSFQPVTLQFARLTLGWYLPLIAQLTKRFPHIGRFIDERPFVTGAIIKIPLRLEFILKKLLIGDWVGAGVGLSWMLLGDVALAFNDEGLRAAVEQLDATEITGGEELAVS